MNAYNPLDSMRRLEAAGLDRKHAEAIATEINDGMDSLVTKEDLNSALDRQTVKLGGFVAAMIALAATVVGVVISIQ